MTDESGRGAQRPPARLQGCEPEDPDDRYGEVKAQLCELDAVVGAETTDHLVQVFLNHIPTALDSCRRAAGEQDARALRDAAHATKSAFSQFGTPELLERLQALEDLGDSGTTHRAAPLLEEIRSDFLRLRYFYETWLPERESRRR